MIHTNFRATLTNKKYRILLTIPVLLAGLLAFTFNAGAAACTTTLSTGANVRTAVANAPAGAVICLNNGDYGYVSLDNIDKPNYVTLRSTSGQGATIGFPQDSSNNLGLAGVSGSSYLNFESLTIKGMTIISSENIRLSENDFVGPYNFQIRANTTDLNNIFVDNNHFDGFTETSYEARFHIPGPSTNASTDPGRNIKVTNNTFIGGCNDAIQGGGKGVEISGNLFENILQDGCDVNIWHTDAIQVIGDADYKIHGNYFHNVGVGIQGPDGFHENLEITHNVIYAIESQPGITLGGTENGLIAHNTTNRFIKSVASAQSNPTFNTIFRDNIASGYDYPSDSNSVPTGGNVVINNILFSTAEFTGCSPAGCIPSTWAGYILASGSPGKGAASDNSGDIGTQIFAPGDALPSIDDTTAPSVPASLSTASHSSSQVNLTWSSSNDNFQTVGYKIFRGSTQVGTSATTSYSDSGVSAEQTYSYTVKAYDVTGNTSAASSSASATTPTLSTLWNSSATPANADVNDSGAVELGTKFRSSTSGTVTAIRFYKGTNNTGTHVGHLWSAGGTQLAAVTFTGETSAGWQEAELSQPVPISANTTYVVSYYAPNGHYAANSDYFASQLNSSPLSASAHESGNPNGLYVYGGGFPSNSGNGANYWVDVRFSLEDVPADTTAPSTPTSPSLTPYMTQANLSWTASTDNIGVTGYKVYRGGTEIATTTNTSYVDTSVIPGLTYSYTVKAVDQAANLSSASSSVSATIPTSATIWANSATPANPNVSDNAIEIGTKFKTSVAGNATAIRFYKGTDNTGTHVGHLWSAGGTQLASVTFSGESSNGWQEATLDTPVSLSANTTYVVSYYAPNGGYAATGNYFTSEISNPPLTALANSSNGVYMYGGGFPSNTYNSTNYWVDVRFSTADTSAPTVAITAPSNAATVDGTVNVTANASDNIDVSKVEFYVDGTLKSTDTTSPYSYSWDTLTAANGSRSLTAKAYDTSNNVTTSSAVSVTVANDTEAPSVPGSVSTTVLSTSSVKVTWTASTDNIGVTGYKVYRGGTEIANLNALTYTDTGLTSGTSYNYTVRAYDAKGNQSAQSSAVAGRAAYQVGVDTIATTKQTINSVNTKTPLFSTSGNNELLVAFIATDGHDVYTQSITSVTGGGLTWTMQKRANTQFGTSEIWTAVAPTPLTNVEVNALKDYGGYKGYISVVAFTNADTSNIGASAGASAANGAASVNLTTTRGGSWIWAVGNDWDTATARSVLSGQDKVDEFLTANNDTYWVQRLTNSSSLGQSVTIGTSAPTSDQWNFAALEILPKL